MKKLVNNIFLPIIRFIDKRIVTPITKLFVNISSKYGDSGKKFEKILAKPNTLLFVSLFLAIIIFIVIDQRIISFTDNTAEVLKDRKIKVIYNEEKYVVEGLPDKVDITLIGSKTDLYIAKQSASDYVTVDLSGLKPGTHKVNVEYNQNNSSIDYTVNPSTITVIIHEKVSETRTLSVDLLNKDSLDSKLVVDKTDYDTDKIVVKGSEAQLKRVVAVKALVDLTNIPEQAAGTYTLSDVPLKAYDSDGEVVDVEGLKDNKTYKVEIEKPVGVKSMSVNNVTVTVTLGEVSTKKIDDISIEPINLSDDYTAQGTDESATKVTVTLKGVKSVIDAITADDIQAYIDLQDYTEGEYEVEVQVNGSDNKVQYTSMTKKVKVTISKK